MSEIKHEYQTYLTCMGCGEIFIDRYEHFEKSEAAEVQCGGCGLIQVAIQHKIITYSTRSNLPVMVSITDKGKRCVEAIMRGEVKSIAEFEELEGKTVQS